MSFLEATDMAVQDSNSPVHRRQRSQDRPASPVRKRPRLEQGAHDQMAIENGHAGPEHCNGDAADSEQASGEQQAWLGSSGQPRINRSEYIRLIEQALVGLGFTDVAQQLERSSGVQHQALEVSQFRAAILQGAWDEATRLLEHLRLGNSENLSKAKFLLLEQKYLEVSNSRS